MAVREFTWDDYDAVAALWQALGLFRPAIDSREALAVCVMQNPGLFLVATDPVTGQVTGTVLGTYDGRRGYLYHVAVAPDRHRQGYGRALVEEILSRLWARGAAKITLRVNHDNYGALAFYRTLGLLSDDHVVGVSIERPT